MGTLPFSRCAGIFFIFLCLTLPGCGRAGGGLDDGLYLGTRYAFGTLNIETFHIGGNRIVMNPRDGVDPLDVGKQNPEDVGNFTLEGKDKLRVKWGGGRAPSVLSVEMANGRISALDGMLVSKAGAYPKNENFEATFSGSLSAGGGAVAAARDLVLTGDGKFRMGTVGSISSADVSGSSSADSRGTYTLGGNTLVLKYDNNRFERHTVLPFSTAAEGAREQLGDERMIYDQMSLRRIK